MNDRFDDNTTRKFAENGKCPKAWQAFEENALRKLDMVLNVPKLSDLERPPSNHLEALKHNLSGWYSIRIKNGVPWRIVFQWENDHAVRIRIEDYHK